MEDSSENTSASPENENIKTKKRGVRKRQVHNEVERRRKDKINSWIMKISELLPNKELHKRSKISILEQTVEFIKILINERDKLLSNQCSEIQSQEIKSLQQSLKIMEEQNAVYAKLLQQANVNSNLLPKKTMKYSDKFTKETGDMLAAKLHIHPNVGEKVAKNKTGSNAIGTNRIVLSENVIPIGAIVTTDPAVSSSTLCSVPNFLQTNTVGIGNNVAVTTQLLTNSILLNGSVSRSPHLQASSRDALNTGGVTSALPSLPVMSSTLGSSISTIYSKSMQVILLPTGASLIQPSIVPSSLSVINQSLENILPVVVPHTVPIPAINLITESTKTQIVECSSIPATAVSSNNGTPQIVSMENVTVTPTVSSKDSNTIVPSTIPVPLEASIETLVCNGKTAENDKLESSGLDKEESPKLHGEDTGRKTCEDHEELSISNKSIGDSSSPVSELVKINEKVAEESLETQQVPEVLPQCASAEVDIQASNSPIDDGSTATNDKQSSEKQLPINNEENSVCNNAEVSALLPEAYILNEVLKASMDLLTSTAETQILASPSSAETIVECTEQFLVETDAVGPNKNDLDSKRRDAVKEPIVSESATQLTDCKISDKNKTLISHSETIHHNDANTLSAETEIQETVKLHDSKSSHVNSCPENITECPAETITPLYTEPETTKVADTNVRTHDEENYSVLSSNNNNNNNNTVAVLEESISNKTMTLPKFSTTFDNQTCKSTGEEPQRHVQTLGNFSCENLVSQINEKEPNNVRTSVGTFADGHDGQTIVNSPASFSNSVYSKLTDTTFSNTISCSLSMNAVTNRSCLNVQTDAEKPANVTEAIPWCDNTAKLDSKSKYVPSTKSMQDLPGYIPSIQQNNSIKQDSPIKTNAKTKLSTCTKNRSQRLPKKSKSLSVIPISSHPILPEIVPNISSYLDYTFDVMNPVLEHSINKTNSMNKLGSKISSDILAKAAESIFGHDTFHSIDSHETSADLASIHLEATASFSNADIFSQTFVLSQPSKPNVESNPATKISNENSPMCLGKVNVENAQNRKTHYQGLSSSEPPVKKAKDTLYCPGSMQNLHQAKSTTSSQANSSLITTTLHYSQATNSQNIITTGSAPLYSTMGTGIASLPQLMTEISVSKNVAPKNQITIPEERNESRQNISLGLPNTSNLDYSQTYLQPFNLITHPVNNLFDNHTNNQTKTSTSYHNSPSQNTKKSLQNDIHVVKSLASSIGMRPSSKSLPIQSQTSTANVCNSSINFLPHHNTLLFPGIHDMNVQSTQSSTQSSAIPFEAYNSNNMHSTIPSSYEKNPPVIHTQQVLPPLLSRNPTCGVPMSFNSNVQRAPGGEISNNKTMTFTNPDSLSHSLCSLLKENNQSTRAYTLTSNVASTMVPVPSIQTNAAKSNYSALSLISRQTYVSNSKPTKTSTSFMCSASSTASSSLAPCAQSPAINNKPSKTSLSYSAERLIQNQCPSQKDRTSNSIPNFLAPKKPDISATPFVQETYKPSGSFTSVSSSELASQTIPLPLPPVTSFPSFPPGFSMCDIRPPVSSIHHNPVGAQFPDVPPSLAKDNLLSHNTNFNLVPQVQSNTRTSQSVGLPKTHSNLSLNVESNGNIYNSCNFLQHPKSNLDMMKTSDAGNCFQSLFVNSGYPPQQPPKQNYCHFMDQTVNESTDISVDKSFTILPPMPSFHGDKLVSHHLPISVSQNNANYAGNIFYEPTSCSHKNIESNKTLKNSQEIFAPQRSKPASNGHSQNLVPSGQQKTLPSSKAKSKKMKQSSMSNMDASRAIPFNANSSMNFNVFPVPEVPTNKSCHNPKNFLKPPSQSLVPGMGELPNQQNKMVEAMLGPPVIPVSTAFNPGLPQQNDGFLNLNFQPPNYADGSLAMHPSLTSCPSTKSNRSFPSATHPVPNFNLSNILPDMGCPSSNDLNLSPMKFLSATQGHQDCQPNSTGTVLAPSRQPFYPVPPHPSVVPNALPPLINHGTHSLSQNQPPLSISGPIPQPPHFSTTTNPPFRNVIHSLNLARNER